MAAYLIAEVKVTDQSWIPDYVKHLHGLVAKHGGKYLSRSPNVKAIEGERPDVTIVAIVEFPSMDKLDAFISDPQYRPLAEARIAGSQSRLYAIADTDVAGTIPYLPKVQ
jgi:uncharacterized protein (DUF1330 family)